MGDKRKMTEKELKQKAEENYYKTYPVTLNIGKEVTDIFLAGLKAGKNANEGEIYELSMKITELQELLTDCLFYCYHVDPYYIDCLKEDEIFERAEKLGVKYNV